MDDALRLSPDALGTAIREAVEYVNDNGWGQPPVLFGLVPTAVMAEHLDDDTLDEAELTVVEQDPLPFIDDDRTDPAELEYILGTTAWPDAVAGALLIQEIVVLPPEAESDLDTAFLSGSPDESDDLALQTARQHPDGRSARLAIAVLRDGTNLRLLQLKPDDDDAPVELLKHPDLAADVATALHATFSNEL